MTGIAGEFNYEMLYISLAFSPQATSRKYRRNTDCFQARSPFLSTLLLACAPVRASSSPFASPPACLPMRLLYWSPNPLPQLCYLLPLFCSELLHRHQSVCLSERERAVSFTTPTALPQCQVFDCPKPSSLQLSTIFSFSEFFPRPEPCQHCGSVATFFSSRSPFWVCLPCVLGETQSIFQCTLQPSKEGSRWCFVIGGHHLPLEAFTGCSTG